MAGNHSKSGLAQTPEIRPQLSTRPNYQFSGRTSSPAAGRRRSRWGETMELMPVGSGDLLAFLLFSILVRQGPLLDWSF